MMRVRRGALAAVVATLLLSACGGGERERQRRGPRGSSTNNGKSGGVPDACTLYDVADIAAAFGGTPGAGKASGADTRRVCMYDAGTIVGVAEANQYEGSLSLAKTNGSTCADTTGVGDKAAFCNVYGQVGQLFWVDGDLMYDISAATVDEAKFRSLAATRKT